MADRILPGGDLIAGRLPTKAEVPDPMLRIAALMRNPGRAADGFAADKSDTGVLGAAIELSPQNSAAIPMTWAEVAAIDDAYLRWAWAARVNPNRIPADAADPCAYVQAAIDERRKRG